MKETKETKQAQDAKEVQEADKVTQERPLAKGVSLLSCVRTFPTMWDACQQLNAYDGPGSRFAQHVAEVQISGLTPRSKK